MSLNKKPGNGTTYLIEERAFLKGLWNRLKELWFSLKVQYHFTSNFRELHFIGPCITVYGPAQYHNINPYYLKAVEVGNPALFSLVFLKDFEYRVCKCLRYKNGKER